jgi:hypothetical protein
MVWLQKKNQWIAQKIGITSRRVFQIELGALSAFGFTMMQIGEWGLAIAFWVFLGIILFSKAFSWEGIQARKALTIFLRLLFAFGALVLSVVLIMITVLRKPDSEPWTSLQRLWAKPTQPLVIGSYPTGVYGEPNQKAITVDLDIYNPNEDAITNLDLLLNTTKFYIVGGISQMPTGAPDCKFTGTIPNDSRITLRGADGDSKLTLDAGDLFAHDNVFQYWKLWCPRISAGSHLRLQVSKGGGIDDSIHLFGTYELSPSAGNKVVKLEKAVPIAH